MTGLYFYHSNVFWARNNYKVEFAHKLSQGESKLSGLPFRKPLCPYSTYDLLYNAAFEGSAPGFETQLLFSLWTHSQL